MEAPHITDYPARERCRAPGQLYHPDPEMGLRALLRDISTSNRILVMVPSLDPGGKRYGWPVTDFLIKMMLDDINLGGRKFEVDVLAGYSKGYRGMMLTLWNLKHLPSLSPEPTLIYFDDLYLMYDGQNNPTTLETLQQFKKQRGCGSSCA